MVDAAFRYRDVRIWPQWRQKRPVAGALEKMYKPRSATVTKVVLGREFMGAITQLMAKHGVLVRSMVKLMSTETGLSYKAI